MTRYKIIEREWKKGRKFLSLVDTSDTQYDLLFSQYPVIANGEPNKQKSMFYANDGRKYKIYCDWSAKEIK